MTAITDFENGSNVLASLPTGWGKSLPQLILSSLVDGGDQFTLENYHTYFINCEKDNDQRIQSIQIVVIVLWEFKNRHSFKKEFYQFLSCSELRTGTPISENIIFFKNI